MDEAHRLGLAVFLDVVYNHLGPDGAYAAAFMPVFTPKHATPWGQAVNLDDEGSGGVRAFLVANALHWLGEYHLDGLRLDATHALVDDSEPHFLAALAEAASGLDGPPRLLVAEDERNLNRLVLPRPEGYGLDAVWADDLHHQIRNVTAGDAAGYYADFEGTTAADIAVMLRQGWFFDGKPKPTTGEPRGTSTEKIRPEQCVVCIQNHDQIGNRPAGDRLTESVTAAEYRAASALLLLAPELPLLFMGQEWAASTPFQFFTDHNEELGPLVSAGRKAEFEGFAGFTGEVPDPQDPATFERSRLDWDEPSRPGHAHTLALYRALLALRRDLDGLVEAEALADRAPPPPPGRPHRPRRLRTRGRPRPARRRGRSAHRAARVRPGPRAARARRRPRPLRPRRRRRPPPDVAGLAARSASGATCSTPQRLPRWCRLERLFGPADKSLLPPPGAGRGRLSQSSTPPNPSFPRRRESRASGDAGARPPWVPACAGTTLRERGLKAIRCVKTYPCQPPGGGREGGVGVDSPVRSPGSAPSPALPRWGRETDAIPNSL